MFNWGRITRFRYFKYLNCGMKTNLFAVLTFCCANIACLSSQKTHSQIRQGIEGNISIQSGNMMPSPNRPSPRPHGIMATIYIYEPTNLSQVARVGTSTFYTDIRTKLIASVQSDSTGHFIVALPPGSYSLFTKQNNQFYANLFDTNNNISLYTVEKDKLTPVKFNVNYAATY